MTIVGEGAGGQTEDGLWQFKMADKACSGDTRRGWG